MVTFDYEGVYIVFGFIYTINLFSELKLLSTRADFLSLPASTEEKYLPNGFLEMYSTGWESSWYLQYFSWYKN